MPHLAVLKPEAAFSEECNFLDRHLRLSADGPGKAAIAGAKPE
jgi:hypothetical protein